MKKRNFILLVICGILLSAAIGYGTGYTALDRYIRKNTVPADVVTEPVVRTDESRTMGAVPDMELEFVRIDKNASEKETSLQGMPFQYRYKQSYDHLVVKSNYKFDIGDFSYQLDYEQNGEYYLVRQYTNFFAIAGAQRVGKVGDTVQEISFSAGTFKKPGKYRLYLSDVGYCYFTLPEE